MAMYMHAWQALLSFRHGDAVKLLIPASNQRLDMGSCNSNKSVKSATSKVLFKKLSDKANTGLVKHGDEVGIFSVDSGVRLDAEDACADEEHTSWATVFSVQPGPGRHLRYNSPVELFSTQNDTQLDLAFASTTPEEEAGYTQFRIEVQRP